MAVLPTSLLDSLEGLPGFDKEKFQTVHQSGEQVTSIRINPLKLSADNIEKLFDSNSPSKIPWCSNGYYLDYRPSFVFDPLFHAGCYYVQEASSMFLEQALSQTTDLNKPMRVLDLCAAPGGKSTLLQSMLNRDSVLVSNEVIKSRANVLLENITKWGGANVIVTNNDPLDFARLTACFDAIVVDAPCSGSGLFRRDPEAVGEWSLQQVQMCSKRQQRILADVLPSLADDGMLIYSTCSYSKEENEDIIDWMLSEFNMESCSIKTDPGWHIVETRTSLQKGFGYRFWPHQLNGEGLFIACLRKKGGEKIIGRINKKSPIEKLSRKYQELILPWFKNDNVPDFYSMNGVVMGFSGGILQLLQQLISTSIYIRQAGISIGKIAGNELVPDHAFAVSTMVSDSIVAISLNHRQAVQYLSKLEVEEIDSRIETGRKGWALMQFESIPLGWVKILPNRINNYYPKEWRILKKPGN